jgi:hypothetical protein
MALIRLDTCKLFEELMPITVTGPAWPTTELLRNALQDAPETGTFQFGGPPRHTAIEQFQRFSDAGLRVPEFTCDPAQANAWSVEGKTVLGRHLVHSRGTDIVSIQHCRFWKSDFWVVLVEPVVYEWRMHVFNGRTIARGLKVSSTLPWRKLPIRNRNNGWTMRHDVDPPKGLRRVAKKAVAALDYPYGAVDLLVTRDAPELEDYDVVVLEVNRAPGLSSRSVLAAYVAAIRFSFRNDSSER